MHDCSHHWAQARSSYRKQDADGTGDANGIVDKSDDQDKIDDQGDAAGTVDVSDVSAAGHLPRAYVALPGHGPLPQRLPQRWPRATLTAAAERAAGDNSGRCGAREAGHCRVGAVETRHGPLQSPRRRPPWAAAEPPKLAAAAMFRRFTVSPFHLCTRHPHFSPTLLLHSSPSSVRPPQPVEGFPERGAGRPLRVSHNPPPALSSFLRQAAAARRVSPVSRLACFTRFTAYPGAARGLEAHPGSRPYQWARLPAMA